MSIKLINWIPFFRFYFMDEKRDIRNDIFNSVFVNESFKGAISISEHGLCFQSFERILLLKEYKFEIPFDKIVNIIAFNEMGIFDNYIHLKLSSNFWLSFEIFDRKDELFRLLKDRCRLS